MAQAQKLGRDVTINATVLRYDVVDSGDANDGSALAQGLDLLKARVSLSKSGQHVEYTLKVCLDQGQSWTLQRRFSQVAALHEALKRQLPSVPDLPAKTVVRQFSPEYLEFRKAALSSYLRELCQRRDALNCAETQLFLGLREHASRFRTLSGFDPVLVAEVREASYGITSFVYDALQGLLLLGASDCNWASRMDTKITNFKLPWEPVAPELPSSQMSLWRESSGGFRFEMQFACRYSPSMACVALATGHDGRGGCCLCGLGDGSVGVQHLTAPSGVSRGTTLPLLRHTASVVALAVDETEHWLISASKDSAVKVYDLVRQMIQCEVQTPSPTTAMTYSQAQRRLFTGLQSGRVVVWDTSILPIQNLCTIPDSADVSALSRISSLDFDCNSAMLFSTCKDSIGVWAVKSSSTGNWGRRVGAVPTSNVPSAVAWAPSSKEILVGYGSGALVAFDVEKNVPSYAWQAHQEEVTAMRWLDAQRRLLTVSKDKTLKIWDFPSLQREPLDEHAISQPTVSASANLAVPGRVRAPPKASTGYASEPCEASRSSSSSHPASRVVQPCQAPIPPPAPVQAGYSERPRVAGAPAGSPALRADDSDDDLAGWDR
eukprot:TRINITY_DN32221_c0_g1_i1.p1 TRINITY_DN32221_c0_g1~~TRINITY_DN32221_c0_g1_i1.p1  ORF type:complete len:621 (-),score=109.94 TRINITY_DN32221_c0_g1_i1:9-1820(-)